MNLIDFVNIKLAILTVLAQIFIVGAFVFIVFFKKNNQTIRKFFEKYGLLFAFITALTATLGSLFYSEIAHYNPCELCWYQRIFMYPQVILLGWALIKKERVIVSYALILSVIGSAIALYHHLMQIGILSGLSCAAIGYSVSCAKVFVMQFGYITLPLMAFTAFMQIIVCLYFARQKKI